ncbi:hypothetical protein [Gracilibacillus alcaliphilus]|uniref:hypothetical protein n=1 Tax=Gracilibacillus alcaliphilus TaxID=1401441 RepID=UPI001957B4C7|nr:hypothetical protein [Gracilibacillus alcaliphilus]MBM7676437.1 ABC-type multidrug transport system fused ATPase/permease subunit [Gracilibacillus alcaliphilus]
MSISVLAREDYSSEKGDILNIYTNDIPIISSLVSKSKKDGIEQGMILFITIMILLMIDVRIALISLIGIPFYLMLPLCFRQKIADQ